MFFLWFGMWSGGGWGSDPRGSGPEGSNLEHAVAAANAADAGAHGFEDQGGVDGADECVQLALVAGQLDDVGRVGDVDDAGAEDVGGALDLLAVLAGSADLDQHQFAFDVRGFGDVH